MSTLHQKQKHYLHNAFVPYPYVHNEMVPELNGIGGMAVFASSDSSTRRQMFTTQLGQALDIECADEAFMQTGIERKFGEATFAVRAPANMRVIKVVPFYQKDAIFQGIRYNSTNYVLYEDNDTGKIGIVTLPEYASFHPYFGFPYKQMSGVELKRGGYIAKDTRILDTANVWEDGTYCFGKNVNVAFLSHPAIAEDGFIMSESARKLFPYYTYEHRVVSFGASDFALNLYGDDTYYKPCPDIGEKIRKDGLLMALRSYDDALAGCEQSRLSTRIVDPISDEGIWSDAGEGVVVDIQVLHDDCAGLPGIPIGMEQQFLKYHEGRKKFYQEIMTTVAEIRKNNRGKISLTPELQGLLVDATAYLHQSDGRQKVRLTYAQKPLDDWQIHFTIRYKHYPGIGNKLSDLHGGKGVVVEVLPDDHMPVDQDGVRADFIIDGHSTNNRMNPGRLLEHMCNAFRRQVIQKLRKDFGYDPKRQVQVEHVKNWKANDPTGFEMDWNLLMRLYEIISPEHRAAFPEDISEKEVLEHMQYILNHDIHIVIPTNTEREPVDMVEMLERELFRMNCSVSMKDLDGEDIMVFDNTSIAEMHLVLLEKTGDDWSATSSARTQTHGVLSQITKADKYRYPIRNQATRSIGETELRLYTNYGGVEMGAELMDRNNNTTTHAQACLTVLSADKPGKIERLVDRKQIPITGGSAAKIFKSIIKCGGYGLHYKPYENIHQKPLGFGKIGV